MNEIKPSTQRIKLIERLGELIPTLKRRVYWDDYTTIQSIYRKLNDRPSNTEFIVIFLRHYVQNLNGIIQTEELYQTNPESRELLTRAKEILEGIVNS